MTTTTKGAHAAREMGMQTNLETNDTTLSDAAPELLAALVDLVGLVETKHPQRREWTQAARDAIARAKGQPIMRGCSGCGDEHDVDDLTSDGQCERCVAACTCATCGADVEPDGDDEPLCGDCADEQAAEDDGHCSTCHGTGIGQHGDPDSSFCHACDGGVRRPETDPYEAADRAWERAREGW